MILSDRSLHERLGELIREPDHTLVNPASIDVRIGHTLIIENSGGWSHVDLFVEGRAGKYVMAPGEFVLASTLEWITVPLDLAVELKLKSSRAREGYNHSLAFWVDPGWSGVLTMELQNVTRYRSLPLYPGLRIGQMIVHQLDRPPDRPYSGKYNGDTRVEGSKADTARPYNGRLDEQGR